MQSFQASLIASIVKHAETREYRTTSLGTLIQDYYADVDASDLAGKEAQDWYGAVLTHMKLAAVRTPGVVLARVYNPHFDSHQWQSTHTVIELVNDDMPFLVDTVSQALTRLGYALHLIVHPVLAIKRDKQGRINDEGEIVEESWIHVEIDRVGGAKELQAIRDELLTGLG